MAGGAVTTLLEAIQQIRKEEAQEDRVGSERVVDFVQWKKERGQMVTFKTGGAPFWIDEGRYTVTLKDVAEEQSTIDFGHGMQPRNKWIYSPIVNAAGEVMERDDGMPLEYFEFTGQSIGPKSTARPMIEALLNKSIDGLRAEDVLAEIEQGLGKLKATVAIMETTRQDGEPTSRAVKGSWKAVGATTPRAGRTTAAAGAPRGDEVPF